MKRALFIQHASPYSSNSAAETLDALLVAAAFGMEVSVLFQDDGVWQLMAGQAAGAIGRKSVVSQLNALSLYDVEKVYVDSASLAARGLVVADIAIPAEGVAPAQVAQLIANNDVVFRF